MNLPPGAVLLDDSFGTTVINATDVATPQVYEAMSQQDRALISTFEAWIDNTRPKGLYAEEAVGSYGGTNRRNGGIFMRDRYITPVRSWDQMRLAYDAVTRRHRRRCLPRPPSRWRSPPWTSSRSMQDEQDVYNQIAAKIDLDGACGRSGATCSLYIAGLRRRVVGTQTFKVRGRTHRRQSAPQIHDVHGAVRAEPARPSQGRTRRPRCSAKSSPTSPRPTRPPCSTTSSAGTRPWTTRSSSGSSPAATRRPARDSRTHHPRRPVHQGPVPPQP
jgi:hypothetical protein